MRILVSYACCRALMIASLLLGIPHFSHADPISTADLIRASAANFFVFRSGELGNGPLAASLTFNSDSETAFIFGSSVLAPVLQFEPIPKLFYSTNETVNLSRRFFTNGAQPGTQGFLNDNNREHVFFDADFQIVAPDSAIGVGIPYLWSGMLTIARDPALSNILFSGKLNGTGEASMVFKGPDSSPMELDQIVYGGAFPPQPVPEPATVALVGAGLLGLVGRRWRHRSRGRAK